MSRQDFDFFHGTWQVHNRRRTTLLANTDAWVEFPAECSVRPIVAGIGFIDEMTFPTLGFSGTTIGLFHPERDEWSQYWVSGRNGVLQPPLVGSRSADEALLYGDDDHGGKPIRVRYRWALGGVDAFGWEQAFSDDGEQTWETNWVMDFARVS
jgi:hypothetical protein